MDFLFLVLDASIVDIFKLLQNDLELRLLLKKLFCDLFELGFLLFGFFLMLMMRWQIAHPGEPVPFIGSFLASIFGEDAAKGIEVHLRIRVAAGMRGDFLAFLREAVPYYESPGGIGIRRAPSGPPLGYEERVIHDARRATQRDQQSADLDDDDPNPPAVDMDS